MNSCRIIATIVLALSGVLVPSRARADEWDKKTILTFSQPVEVPGMVLSPGKYVFKLADSDSNRNIVEVFNADETHLYTTILAIPDYHLRPSDQTLVTFEERRRGAPEAVKTWFYPGDESGQEFIYPKAKVMLAKAAAPAAPPAPPAAPPAPKAPVAASTPPAKPLQVARAASPTPPPMATPAAPPPAPAPAMPAKSLPKTASPLPLLALLGSGCLALAAAFDRLGRRIL